MISIIVAIAKNGVIGGENRLLWHISDDLKRFRQLTTGHTIVMGRRTFESLPNGALPNRRNLVITSDLQTKFNNCEVIHSIDELQKMAIKSNDEIFVIGGGSLYRQTLDLADKLYVTWVNREFDGDTFFPEISKEKWEIIEKSGKKTDEKSGLEYEFVDYKQKTIERE